MFRRFAVVAVLGLLVVLTAGLSALARGGVATEAVEDSPPDNPRRDTSK